MADGDEYLEQELDDALEVIAWSPRSPGATASVGMMGISWGGFNCLQVAALRPPALKAVISLCSTVDRYADDIHYKGGCLLNENLWLGHDHAVLSSRPPDPRSPANAGATVADTGWRTTVLSPVAEPSAS